MKVLLVAPRNNLLSVDEEIQDVLRSGLTVTPLIGKVNSTDLLREMRTGDYDVLWLATHGSGEGVQLSDGLFSASALVPQVRDRFTLVVLNTCESLLIAQLLQEEANVGVICTLISVPDTQAYQTGSRLASALAESPNVAAAYLASKPGQNRSYLYLAPFSPTQDAIETVVKKLDALTVAVNQDTVKSTATIRLLQQMLWLSLALHVPEWIALVWLLTSRR